MSQRNSKAHKSAGRINLSSKSEGFDHDIPSIALPPRRNASGESFKFKKLDESRSAQITFPNI